MKRTFTLVELIIVITILAILSVSAFLVVSQWIGKSRDSRRLSDLGTIQRALEVSLTKSNAYPVPDNSIKILYNSTILWYQWEFWDSAKSSTDIKTTPKDPLDNSNYLYSVDVAAKKFQLWAFLENNSVSFLNKNVESADYSTRYIKTAWSTLWFILSPNNNPITTDIDLSTYNSSVKLVTSTDQNSIVWTWLALGILRSNYGWSWKDTDKNCQLDDVAIWNQVWAGCNSTLWKWYIYNVGNNCHDYIWNNPWWTACYWDSTKESSYNSGVWVNNIWWKLYVWNELSLNCKGWGFAWTISNSDCACPTGRHVSTDAEWAALESSLNWSTCRTTDDWECAGLWWSWNKSRNPSNNIVQALKIPLAWARQISWLFDNRWSRATFRTSTSISSWSYRREFVYNLNTVFRSYPDRASWYSIRCVKD